MKEAKTIAVNENFYYLIRYIAETTCEPKARTVYEGRKIGLYLQNVKRGNIKISDNDRDFLERLGVSLTPHNPQELVHKKLIILIEFVETYKRKPVGKDVFKGIPVKQFLDNILSGNTGLSEEDRRKLDEVLKSL